MHIKHAHTFRPKFSHHLSHPSIHIIVTSSFPYHLSHPAFHTIFHIQLSIPSFMSSLCQYLSHPAFLNIFPIQLSPPSFTSNFSQQPSHPTFLTIMHKQVPLLRLCKISSQLDATHLLSHPNVISALHRNGCQLAAGQSLYYLYQNLAETMYITLYALPRLTSDACVSL